MKAFVLKNNKGLYYTTHLDCEGIYTQDISEAYIFDRETANSVRLFLDKATFEKWKVVKITIEEVDKNLTPTNYDNLNIEDKLKYRENQVRIARDRDVEYNNKITELEFTIKRLEEELAEKDKIIETLKKDIESKDCVVKLYSTIASTNTTKMNIAKEIRKQVCNEISDYINKNTYEVWTKEYGNTDVANINEILDFIQEIEKGE